MAYADRQTGASRLASIVTVGAIHTAIGAGLIYGFAPGIVELIRPQRTVAFTVPPVVPTSPPADKPVADRDFITAPPRPIDLPPIGPDIPVRDPIATPNDFGRVEIPLPDLGPISPPSDAVPAKAPSPANDMSRWVTPLDYPSRDLKLGNEGQTRFRVVVGTDGKVKSCEIVASSGFASLDNAVCAKVSSRARFKPGTDGSGAKIVDTYTSTVRWQIPD